MTVSKLTSTSRGSDKKVQLPTAANVHDAMFANPAASQYLLQQLEKKLKSVGLLDQADDLIQKVKEFVEIVEQQHSSRGNIWGGSRACELTDFQNLQTNRAKAAQEVVSRSMSDSQIRLDYAVNSDSQFLRGYSADGKPLEGELLKSCDDLFNAWLAENNIISITGELYDVNDNGEMIRNDGSGMVTKNAAEARKANVERINSLITDPNKSFEAYLANRSIALVTKKHVYPEQSMEVESRGPQAGSTQAESGGSRAAEVEPDQSGVKPGDSSGSSINRG